MGLVENTHQGGRRQRASHRDPSGCGKYEGLGVAGSAVVRGVRGYPVAHEGLEVWVSSLHGSKDGGAATVAEGSLDVE